MGLFDNFRGYKRKRFVRIKDSGNFLVRYVKSFLHAIDGFIYALCYEHNMIIIVISAILTVTCGVVFKISTSEWLFCIMAIGMVAATEMINTAIEAIVDLTVQDIHPLAKVAKDTASTATLIFSLVAFIGGLMIFVPKLITLLS